MPEASERPTEIISVRVPPTLRRKLKAAAAVEGGTVSEVARRALRTVADQTLILAAGGDPPEGDQPGAQPSPRQSDSRGPGASS